MHSHLRTSETTSLAPANNGSQQSLTLVSRPGSSCPLKCVVDLVVCFYQVASVTSVIKLGDTVSSILLALSLAHLLAHSDAASWHVVRYSRQKPTWAEIKEGLWPTAHKELSEAYRELNPANHGSELVREPFPPKPWDDCSHGETQSRGSRGRCSDPGPTETARS